MSCGYCSPLYSCAVYVCSAPKESIKCRRESCVQGDCAYGSAQFTALQQVLEQYKECRLRRTLERSSAGAKLHNTCSIVGSGLKGAQCKAAPPTSPTAALYFVQLCRLREAKLHLPQRKQSQPKLQQLHPSLSFKYKTIYINNKLLILRKITIEVQINENRQKYKCCKK